MRLLILLAIILLCPALGEATNITVDKNSFKLAEKMRWHKATPNLDQLDVVLKLPSEFWHPAPDNDMTLGFVHSIFWVRSELTVQQAGTWLLETNNPTLQEISVWLINEDLDVQKIGFSGLKFPFGEGREFNLPDFIFPVSFKNKGNYTLLYRIQQNGFFDLPAQLRSATDLINTEAKHAYERGLYYGFFLSVLFITLVYLVTTRDLSFLAFAAFISGFTLFFGYVDGVSAQYFWPLFPALNKNVLHLSIPLMDVGIAWFALTFFNIPKSLIWLKYLLISQIIIALCIALFSFFIGISTVITLSLLLALISIASSLLIGFILMIKYHEKIAIPFTVAWIFFGGYILFISLSITNILPFSVNDVLSSLKSAYAIQMCLLFAALAMRFRTVESESIRAKSQNNSKTELLTRVSHEIRTPMNGILGLSKILGSHIKDSEGQQYRHLIIESTESLLGIVNDLLDSRQIDEGRIEILDTPIKVTDIVRSTFEILQLQITEKGLQAHLTLPENNIRWTLGDEVRLRQIIINLIGNAIKFTQKGSIHCELIHDTNKKEYQLSVTDTGKGISKSDQSRILLPFEQATRSKTEIYSGTGLGLFITNHLIHLMKGKLNIQSELGEGTSITVTIPAITTSAPANSIISDDTSANRNLKILIAEDNQSHQIIIRNILEKQNHDLTVVENGQAAFESYKENTYDLILMDCEMPIKDGYEAATDIRKFETDSNRRRTPIIALTAHAIDEHLEKIINAGMDAQATKPIKWANLNTIINKLTNP